MGDFTPLGWTTTVLYAVACYLCYQTYSSYHSLDRLTPALLVQRKGWALLILFVSALGLNKQLDVQTWVTQGGKHLIVFLELYQYHRLVQVAVFILAACFAFGSFFLALPVFFKAERHLRVALCGLGFIAAYVLFRAALFQRISSHVELPVVPWLEPLGILTIAAAAYGKRNQLRRRGAKS